MERFLDRRDAGKRLAGELQNYREREDVVILALPRGGVPVAYEIACELGAPLDVFVVRKLGFPGFEEFAVGAIASGGVRVMNPGASRMGEFSDEEIEKISAREHRELERREREYRGDRGLIDVAGKTVILVDDGLATGSTMRAAVAGLRLLHPRRIVVAVPVGSSDACEVLSREADEVVCLAVPKPFRSVGEWYHDFSQTSDAEVQELLQRGLFAESN